MENLFLLVILVNFMRIQSDGPLIACSPSDPAENDTVTLTCTDSSTSTFPSNLPTNLRPNMTYSWQRDNRDLPDDGRHTVSGTGGGTLTINTVKRYDHDKPYSCTAEETGSRQRNKKTIRLSVRFPVFLTSPGAVAAYPGESATMTWTIHEPISSSWYLNDGIYYDYFSPSGEQDVYSWSGHQPSRVGSGYSGRISASIQYGSSTISYTLSGITANDTMSNYRCVTTAYGVFDNTHAWFILYDVPSIPVITCSSSDPVENTAVTLACTASSTSTFPYNLPTNLRANMTYSWQRDNTDLPNDGRHTVSGTGGRTLNINTVQRQDNGKIYACTARETGSRESNENTISLNVRYPPSSATTQTPQIGPLFEYDNSVTLLICDVLVFYWMHVAL